MDAATENTIYLKNLVEQNQSAIFPKGEPGCLVTGISLSPRLNAHPLSHGRLMTIQYQTAGEAREKVIYLKFRKNYVQLPDKYMAVFNQISDHEQFLPKFYFFAKTPVPNETVIAMEFVQGTSLRRLLYSKMAWGRTGTLKDLFYQNGRKMRMFHDVQAPKGLKTIQELMDSLKSRIADTRYFSGQQKEKIVTTLIAIEQKIDTAIPLGLINIHHDWSLRNIIIEPDQRIKLIDLDAFNRSIDWRWNDFVYFLINIESQIKYWPVLGRRQISTLWENFLQGYFEVGECEAVNAGLLPILIYLIKLDFWTDAYSLDDYYNLGLGKRYVRKLKPALAAGRESILTKVNIC